jgi:hypothetical protein
MLIASPLGSRASTISSEEAREARLLAEARERFPYEIVETHGANAFGAWLRLKEEGRSSTVVVGGRSELLSVLEPFLPNYFAPGDEPKVDDVLSKAKELQHPDSMADFREAEARAYQRLLQSNPALRRAEQAFLEQLAGQGIRIDLNPEPPLGTWPGRPPNPLTLTVVEDWRTREPYEVAYLIRIPDDDWTTIPAHLRWGGWNENPPAEYHVAAFRAWRDRYGAELVGISPDVLNLRVATRPFSRAEAIDLAREQYVYCRDIIDQGAGTLSNLAAGLISSDWWYFWWD